MKQYASDMAFTDSEKPYKQGMAQEVLMQELSKPVNRLKNAFVN